MQEEKTLDLVKDKLNTLVDFFDRNSDFSKGVSPYLVLVVRQGVSSVGVVDFVFEFLLLCSSQYILPDIFPHSFSSSHGHEVVCVTPLMHALKKSMSCPLSI